MDLLKMLGSCQKMHKKAWCMNLYRSSSLHRAFCSLFSQYTNKCTYIHFMI